MTIQEFIEKAGYDPVEIFNKNKKFEIFLDPLAWQAVGKVEGWGKSSYPEFTYGKNHSMTSSTTKNYRWRMHAMIDALIAGKTLEEYIESL